MTTGALEGVKWAEDGTKSSILAEIGLAHGFVRGADLPLAPDKPQHHRQVHGVTILEADPARSGAALAERADADGIYSRRAGERIAVKTADCLPILLADTERRLVMAVHAGWRGLTAGILPRAVELFAAHGIPPGALAVAIGPAIGREAFEVGPEVVQALAGPAARLTAEQSALAVAKGKGDRWHVDLTVAAVLQARNAGIAAARIEAIQSCTFKRSDRWHSYRRERAAHGSLTGSNWAWISL